MDERLGQVFPRHEIQDIIGDSVNVDHPTNQNNSAANSSGEGDGNSTSNGSSNNNSSNGNGGSHIFYATFLALWERNNKKKVREIKNRCWKVNAI